MAPNRVPFQEPTITGSDSRCGIGTTGTGVAGTPATTEAADSGTASPSARMRSPLVKAYISSAYADAVSFVILILVLLVKPSGLFGSTAMEKV